MTCPTGNRPQLCLTLNSPSSNTPTLKNPSQTNGNSTTVRSLGATCLQRVLTPLFLLACGGLLGLGCSDDGGGSYTPSKRPDDSNDDPRNDRDAGAGDKTDDSDDSDGTGDSDDSDDSNDSDDSDDTPDASGSDAPVSPGPKDLPVVSEDAEDSWTILVYMNGDNDLEHFALQDIAEMAVVPDSDKLTILVQLDRAIDGASPGYSSADLLSLGEFTSTKRLRIRFNEIEELDDIGEVNMGDANTLADFVTWGIKESETGHYGLVFWDHGGGWDLFGPDDSHDHDGLKLPEIAAGLRDGLAGAKHKTKLDLVGFDACLMATFETAESVRPYSSLLLASQELEPGNGWDWTALSVLSDDPSRSARQWGSEVIEKYAPHVGATRNATLSLVDLDKLGELKEALGDFATDLGKVEPVVVGQVRAQSPEFAAGHGKDLVDLGTLVSSLSAADEAVKSSAKDVLNLLEEVVVTNYHGPDAGYAHGLSLYFPLNPYRFDKEYSKLAGIDAWQKYLTSYLDAGALITELPGFTNPDNIGDFTYDTGLLYLSGNLAAGTAEQLVSADLYFGMSIDGVLVFLGQTDGQWDDSFAYGAWDLTALMGYQGDVSAPFYYAQHYSSESQTFSFTTPVLYNGTYMLYYEMVLDSNFDLISSTYYGEIEGAIGQVSVGNEGTIQPVLIAMDSDGTVSEVPLDTTFDLSVSDISFAFEVLPSGSNIGMALVITDLGGNTDAVYNETSL